MPAGEVSVEFVVVLERVSAISEVSDSESLELKGISISWIVDE